jgi:arsenate reductase
MKPVTLRRHYGTRSPKLPLMSDYTLFHNPRCTKSRETLALLERNGVQPQIIEYLKTPPTAAELKAIVAKLGIKPEQLVRKGEEIYKSQYAGKSLTDAQWIDAMVTHPILIERPIVIKGPRAVLGRPPENVNALLKK